MDSNIGHFYIEFSGPGVEKNKVFFGQNPKMKNSPIAFGQILNEQDRYYEAQKNKKATTKEIKLTKEQFEAAYDWKKNW